MLHGSLSFAIRISGFEADADSQGHRKSGQQRLALVRSCRQTADSFFPKILREPGQNSDSGQNRDMQNPDRRQAPDTDSAVLVYEH